jgi:endogenous inhibitor of DNA gyrase (YacG/DUF329 family)
MTNNFNKEVKMICPNCKKDVKWEDFYGKDVCYKCMYERKIKNKKRTCVICREDLPKNRWVYCSKKCGEIGALTKRDAYLKTCTKISIPDMNWHDYPVQHVQQRFSHSFFRKNSDFF